MTTAINAQFTFERETKGTFVYVEDGPKDQHKVGTLYIKKSAMGSTPDDKIEIAIISK